MEILALLLLGLIAMLAIVPPIIKGKLEESPLVTAQTFQRSLQEMAHSLEAGAQRNTEPEEGLRTSSLSHGSVIQGRRTGSRVRPLPRRTSAAVRRNRIMAFLISISIAWGAATLFSGRLWCLILFVFCTLLLVLYWALTIIVPRLPVYGPLPGERLPESETEPERAYYSPRAPSRQRTRTMSM